MEKKRPSLFSIALRDSVPVSSSPTRCGVASILKGRNLNPWCEEHNPIELLKQPCNGELLESCQSQLRQIPLAVVSGSQSDSS